MKNTLLTGLAADGTRLSVLICDGKIAELNPKEVPTHCEISDYGENYILPAFIEVHAHGGGGYDFIDNTEESFDAILNTHLSHGVASICPTLCACDFDSIFKFLELCRTKKAHPAFLGVHLEGPFLSPKMCGAQNLSCLRDPSASDIERLSAYADVISRITVAPELLGASMLAEQMKKLSVKLSVGHTAIDAEGFYKAKEMGYNSVTHLYSSMTGRYKAGSYVKGGLVEAALADDDSYVELIGDGHHVSRENLMLTLKCKGKERLVLVSDAMRAAGTYSPFEDNLGESYLGAAIQENLVVIEDGVAKLPDRSSFAGSIAVGDTMVKAVVGKYGLPLETASYIMSQTPAKLLGLTDRGALATGMRADITILDKNYSTVAVIRGGEAAYERNTNLSKKEEENKHRA